MAGGREQRLVIVERDEIEDQIVDRRMRRAQQRFGAAGALLELQPDHRRLDAAAGSFEKPLGGDRAEADRGRRHRAQPDEITPRHRRRRGSVVE